jgi:hypothetical protein
MIQIPNKDNLKLTIRHKTLKTKKVKYILVLLFGAETLYMVYENKDD